MKNIDRLLNVIIIMSCLLLIISYFLPVESSWSPIDAWEGYYIGEGEFVEGINVGLIEVFPYAVGLIILISLSLFKKPIADISIIIIFSIVWATSLEIEVLRFVRNEYCRFPVLWLGLAASIIPVLLISIILVLWKVRGKKVILTLAVILAVSSILQQACSILWFLLEDNLLLNYGSVTGMSTAAVLLVALLIKRQVLKEAQTSIEEKTVEQETAVETPGIN